MCNLVLQNGETPKPEAPKPPVPRRTAPERKRKPPAALLDNDSEGSSPPALALNGSPRPGAKRKRTALLMKRPRSTHNMNEGVAPFSWDSALQRGLSPLLGAYDSVHRGERLRNSVPRGQMKLAVGILCVLAASSSTLAAMPLPGM